MQQARVSIGYRLDREAENTPNGRQPLSNRVRPLMELALYNIENYRELSRQEAEYRRYRQEPIPIFDVDIPQYRGGLASPPEPVSIDKY